MAAVKEICLRCGTEMEWRCEGEAGDCRDPG